jgi:hypothetical protein
LKATKTLGAGFIALATPLLVLAAAMPAAQATDVTASINLTSTCQWKIANTASTIVLSSNGEKYQGDDLGLYQNTSLTVGAGLGSSIDGDIPVSLSGNTTDCSFFNNIKGVEVTATLTNQAGFTATDNTGTVENGMGFSFTEANPLNFNVAAGTYCPMELFDLEAALTGSDVPVISLGDSSVVVTSATIPNFVAARQPNYTEPNYKIQCLQDFVINVNIPSGLIPEKPGTAYEFSGPVILIAMTTPDQ